MATTISGNRGFIDFGAITSGIRSVTNALRQMASATGARMGKTDLSKITSQAEALSATLQKITRIKPGALEPFEPLADIPKGKFFYGKKRAPILAAGLAKLEMIYKELPTSESVSAFRKGLSDLAKKFPETGGLFRKYIYEGLKQYRDKLDYAARKQTAFAKATEEATAASKRLSRSYASGAMARIMPTFFGKLRGAYATRREGITQAQEMMLLQRGLRGGTFAKLFMPMEALGGAPGASGITKVLGLLSSAGPVVAGIAGAVASLGKAAFGAAKKVVKMGLSILTLPIRIVGRIYRTFQSLLFTVIMVAHVFERFFKEPIQILKDVQTATILAGDSIDQYGQSLKVVTDLGLKYAIPLTEISKGYMEVAKSGFSAAESTIILGEATKYAGVFQSGLSAAIDQTIGVVRAWNLPVTDSTKIVDALYNAVSNSRASIADLTTALGYCSQAAASAGVSFQETLGIITMFRDANIRASRAGMALRSMIAGLQRAQATALGSAMNLKEATEVLAIDWERLGEENLNLTAVFRQFNKVISDGITIQERAALRAIFGLRYQAIITELLKKGNAAFRERVSVIQKEAELEEKSIAIAEELAGTIQRLKNLYTAFKIAILEEVKGPFEDLNNVWERATDLMARVGAAFGRILRSAAFEPLARGFANIFAEKNIEAFETTVVGVAEEIGMWVTKLGGTAKSVLGDIFGDKTHNKLFISNMIDLVGYMLDIAIRAAGEIAKVIKDHIVGFADEFKAVLAQIDVMLNTWLPMFFDAAIRFLTMAIPPMISVISALMEAAFGEVITQKQRQPILDALAEMDFMRRKIALERKWAEEGFLGRRGKEQIWRIEEPVGPFLPGTPEDIELTRRTEEMAEAAEKAAGSLNSFAETAETTREQLADIGEASASAHAGE